MQLLIIKYEADFQYDKTLIDPEKLATSVNLHYAELLMRLQNRTSILKSHCEYLTSHFQTPGEEAQQLYESHINELKKAFNQKKTLKIFQTNITSKLISLDKTRQIMI